MIEIKKIEKKERKAILKHASMYMFVLNVIVFMNIIMMLAKEWIGLITKTFQDISLKRLAV